MSELPIEQKLRSLRWEGNKRTLPRTARVPEADLQVVESLRREGKFAEAINILLAQPPEVLDRDPVALNGLGHLRLGLDDYDNALDAFDRAEKAATFDAAKALLNTANTLKVMKRYDEAEAKAKSCVVVAPAWFASYLMLVAIHECRATPEAWAATEHAIALMKDHAPGWESNAEIWRYILTDADYARLRSDTMFLRLFGITVSEAQGRMNND